MANQSVVDELIVKLTLDASAYEKADKAVDKRVSATERRQQRADRENDRRERKRSDTAAKVRLAQAAASGDMKGLTAVAKGLGGALSSIATIGAGVAAGVAAVGAAAVASASSLVGYENGLRRSTVATGLSNRAMQAWQATAQRLGADAQSGGQAIADLAREQQTARFTGAGPTMLALSRLGVNVGPGVSVGDMLEQAQQKYRQASGPQQGQMEAQLSAMGVAPDLILMIKSNKDAAQMFKRSSDESLQVNQKSIDAWNDASAAMKNASIEFKGILAGIVFPAATAAADGLHAFSVGVNEAGSVVGGIAHVMAQAGDILLSWVTKLARWLDNLTGHRLSASANAVANVAKTAANAVSGMATTAAKAVSGAAAQVGHAWNAEAATDAAANQRNLGFSTAGAPASAGSTAAPIPAVGSGRGSTSTPAVGSIHLSDDQRAVMQEIIRTALAKGLSIAQGAALAGQAFNESGFNPNAHNKFGAEGLFQWLTKGRQQALAAYLAANGGNSVANQVGFAVQELRARRLLRPGQSMEDASRLFTERFETPSKDVAGLEVAANKRWLDLQALHLTPDAIRAAAANSNGPAGGDTTNNTGPTFQIGTVQVAANSPAEFAGGLQRVSSIQNFNSAQR